MALSSLGRAVLGKGQFGKFLYFSLIAFIFQCFY